MLNFIGNNHNVATPSWLQHNWWKTLRAYDAALVYRRCAPAEFDLDPCPAATVCTRLWAQSVVIIQPSATAHAFFLPQRDRVPTICSFVYTTEKKRLQRKTSQQGFTVHPDAHQPANCPASKKALLFPVRNERLPPHTSDLPLSSPFTGIVACFFPTQCARLPST